MNSKYIDACMNSIRQRIMQTILIKGEATAGQIGEELTDVPRASLYRHIKILLDGEVIEVVREEVKRGTVEKTYKMKQPDYRDNDMSTFVMQAINQIVFEFTRYFKKADSDPMRDMLTLGRATLVMSDEEMMEFFTEYGRLIEKYISNKPEDGKKLRNLTLISSPDIEK